MWPVWTIVGEAAVITNSAPLVTPKQRMKTGVLCSHHQHLAMNV